MQRLSSARSLIDRFEPQILQERYAAFQQPLLQRLDDAKEDLISAMQDRTRSSRQQLQLAHVSLEAMSPFAVLQRGYAIVYDDSRNEVVSRIAQAPPAGSSIGVVLADGRITASVTEAAQQEQT